MNENYEMPKLMTIRQIAKTGVIPEHTLRRLVKMGKVPYIEAGNRVLINYTAFVRKLNEM